MTELLMTILTGPTAVERTVMSTQLVKAISGEIIGVDPMQVYHHMDIDSAKITKEEMDGVPYYLTDVLEPWEDFNVAALKRMAKEAMDGILPRGNIPIVTSGTGFYIQALLYDIDFTEHTGDGAICTELEQLAEDKGAAYLHWVLTEIDPELGLEIHVNSIKRVIWAIGYYRQTREPIFLYNRREREKKLPYNFLYYVVNTERSTLYERIERRIDTVMMDDLVEGVRALKDVGCTRNLVSMQGLGYKEALDYLNGEYTLEEAVYILKRGTGHFAKRQIAWFRRERDMK